MNQPTADQTELLQRRLLILGAIVSIATVSAQALKPSSNGENKDSPPTINLDAVIPRQFGHWTESKKINRTVNPETQQILDKLYSQILERTYVDAEGYLMMLSISYGADQRGSMEAHKPEVCYPAQGFEVSLNKRDILHTRYGSVDVRRLITRNGSRHEPLTYWFTMGDTAVESRLDKRFAEIKMMLTGQIPDGLLFRVSSLDKNPDLAWKKQAAFVDELISQVAPDVRKRLSGL